VNDGRRQRLRDVLGQEASNLVNGGDLARLVDLPELREALHLPFEVAARSRERPELRSLRGVDLDERVDEVHAEREPRSFRLEAAREFVRDHVAFEEAHDVERDADHGLVVADGDDLREPREARRADCVLDAGLAHHVVGPRGAVGTWGPPEHKPVAAALDQEGEVRSAAVADPARRDRAGPEAVAVEERLDVLRDQQR